MVASAAGLALAGGAAALWTATLARARRREAQALRRRPPEGRILSVNGHPVHVWVRGSGPDLVLIHGSSGHLGDFTHALAPALAERYRVMAIDRPGLGHTPPVTRGGDPLAVQARLLADTAAALGAERPIVLGQSLGGAVALAWAVHHPERIAALVSVAGVSHPWTTGLGAYYATLSSLPGRHLVIPAMTAWLPPRLVAREVAKIFAPDPVPPGYVEHFCPDLSLRRAALRDNALQRRRLLDCVREQAAHYAKIAVPVEIVHGTADPLVSPGIHSRRLAADVAGANLVLLEGAGHMPHHSRPAEVIAAIDRAAARAGLRPAAGSGSVGA